LGLAQHCTTVTGAKVANETSYIWILTNSSLELTPECPSLITSLKVHSSTLNMAQESQQLFCLLMFVVAAVNNDNKYCPLALG
jgi:hypothetical protein